MATYSQYYSNPYVRAFLDSIGWAEGSNYNTLYGGSTFSDFREHPNRRITAGAYTSTAAGKYQFLIKTWREVKEQLGLRDFSPASQDMAAIKVLGDAGALPYIAAGPTGLREAVRRTTDIWCGLPAIERTGPCKKQRGRSYSDFERNFYHNLGTSTGVYPLPDASIPGTTLEKKKL